MMANGEELIVSSPLFQEFRVQVLEYPAGEDPDEGLASAFALTVMTRSEGALLAVPRDFFGPETISAGLVAAAEDQLGQSLPLTVSAGLVEDLESTAPPVPEEGATVELLLIDVNSEVVSMLRPFVTSELQLDVIHSFDPVIIHLMPMVEDLVRQAQEWVADPASGERVAFYSAAEDVESAAAPRVGPRPKAAAKAPPGTTSGASKRGKPTVASLAMSMEQISATLPKMLQQIESLSHRTQSMEQQMSAGGLKSAALQQPLGSLAAPGHVATSAADLLREVPPPRAPALRTPAKPPPHVPLAKQMAEELEQDLVEEGGSTTLTRAVLEQSKALSTLVTQIAAGETVGDFSSSSTGFSSRGAAGRQRLQQELSLQRGSFFNSIFVQMARRMQPARIAEAAPADLAPRGVTATTYLERYGGYGKCRDLGHIAWQVGMVLDHLQTDNVPAAKDAIALLMVCLEQASMDGGRLDIGLLLSLQEDPPAALFTNRSLAAYSRGKAFAPLAEQKWIATALAYIKELDAISTKRADIAKPPQAPTRDPDAVGPKRAPKRQPKQAAWKKKEHAEEEDQ